MISLIASLVLGAAQTAPVDIKTGVGVAAIQGDLVQLEFLATTPSGKTVADSRKRGLCYNVIAGGDDPILGQALIGIKVDGEREFEVDMQALAKTSDKRRHLPATTIKFHIRAISVTAPKVH